VAERVVVVGGGLAGLAAAAELSATLPVTLVERLPAPGGVWEFDHPDVVALYGVSHRAGVEMILGASAVRWRHHRLLVIGPGQVRWIPATHLVFAGGSRPPTLAEMGVVGGRLAGTFPATVAHHLLEAGVTLGRRPVVLGGSEWADLVIPMLADRGTVTLVGRSGPLRSETGRPRDPEVRVRRWPDHRATRLNGSSRVSSVDLVAAEGVSTTVRCDCVVIAGGLRPLRNVDGAVGDTAVDVTYIQPVEAHLNAEQVISRSRNAAADLRLQLTEGHVHRGRAGAAAAAPVAATGPPIGTSAPSNRA